MVTEHLNFKKQKHGIFLVQKVIFYIIVNFKMCIIINTTAMHVHSISMSQSSSTKLFFFRLRKIDYITAFVFLSLLFE